MRKAFLGYQGDDAHDHGHGAPQLGYEPLLAVEPGYRPAGVVPEATPRTTEDRAWEFAQDALNGLLGLGRTALEQGNEQPAEESQDYNEDFDSQKDPLPTDGTQDFNTPPMTSFAGPTPTSGSTTTKDEGYSTGTKVAITTGVVGGLAALTYGATKGKWFK